MWRLYVGGLCMGFAIGGAVCWLIAVLLAPESARGSLLVNPMFPWVVLLAFGLAGEALRRKGRKFAQENTPPDAARKPGGPA